MPFIFNHLENKFPMEIFIFHFSSDCPAFAVDGSTQATWAASPAGTTVTVECAADHILAGTATLTCQEDGTWSSDIPECDQLGEFI